MDFDLEKFNQVDISIEKETHNLEYIIVLPVAVVVLLVFKYLHYNLPEQYTVALFGVSFYTPITWALIDIYSLFKTGGKYVYKIKIQSYNLLFEVIIGFMSYLITQFTLYIMNLDIKLFSLVGAYYFLIAYTGIIIVRLVDRKLIEIGGWDLIIFGYIFTFVELMLYTLFFVVIIS